MDITPVISKDKKIIESYNDNSFIVNEQRYLTDLIILPTQVIQWQLIQPLAQLANFIPLIKLNKDIELLIVGTGKKHQLLNNNFKFELMNQGLKVEFMQTGAACRTYNILLAEDRKIAAALIRIDPLVSY